MVVVKCRNCGKEKEVYPSRVREGHGNFCDKSCAGLQNQKGKRNSMYGRKGKLAPAYGKRGKLSPNWKGGIHFRRGYVMIYKPDHPFCNNHGYVKRSRLVMEKKLGRYLKPGEITHHANHIRDDDREENLMLLGTKSEHGKFHGRPEGSKRSKEEISKWKKSMRKYWDRNK